MSTPSRFGSGADDARRDRIRSTVQAAVEMIAPSWPLERFVATNPLLALEGLPVEQAAEQARDLLCARAELAETTFRDSFASGRITAADLEAALSDHLRSVGITQTPERDASVRRGLHELLWTPVDEDLPTAPVLAVEWLDLVSGSDWADRVDSASSWWCAAYLSDHPAWPLPGRDDGLYAAWRRAAAHDRRLDRWGPTDPRSFIGDLPDRADDAVLELLVLLDVDRPDHARYIGRHLARHAGWTSALARTGGHRSDDLLAFLAIRLTCEAFVLSDGERRVRAQQAAAVAAECDSATSGGPGSEPAVSTSLLSGRERLAVWRDAYERHYRDGLLALLEPTADPDARCARPEFQAVFCIDPRSEGMRRHLEAVGGHATIGFAGFFGLPIRVQDLDAPTAVPSCPVIVEPQAAVAESPVGRRVGHLGEHPLDTDHEVFATAKRSMASPFALAEAVGWVAGPLMGAKTLAPSLTARMVAAIRRLVQPGVDTRVEPMRGSWWDPATEIEVAATILRMTGLDRNPAPLVLFCGHGSHHHNNLHRAALDCGACGGRPGGANARAAVALLNDPQVRAGLARRGIVVPPDTWFVAGEHDTTTDTVRIFEAADVPATHRPALASLEADLSEAGDRLAADRGRDLPATVGRTVGTNVAAVRRRGQDWAQVIPEWGLAGNAALVIGPRILTSRVDLERRVFLHSYDSDSDSDDSALAAIMGGPLLVAHWISSQYRLSAIDPDRFGAGTKPAHNLVGGIGVTEGAGGDLRLGLPLESLSSAGIRTHEPMRLLVVVDAPTERVDRVTGRNDAVGRLVTNGWIRLVARTQIDGASIWMIRDRDGSWTQWSSAETSPRQPTAASPVRPAAMAVTNP